MKINIDTEKNSIVLERGGEEKKSMPLYSPESFDLISDLWVKMGWNEKYTYTFSWLGRPIIQLPEDMFRIQEVIYHLKPDVIIETGVAHGGSLIFYASLCKMMGKGRVIGVDIEVRPHNRKAIEEHELYPYITLIEGDAVAQDTLDQVKSNLNVDDKVIMAIFDSNHLKDHVKNEMIMYQQFVTVGSYMVVTDGLLNDLQDVPRGKEEWRDSNPLLAVEEFMLENTGFELEEPEWKFNESYLKNNVTHWPSAYLRRKSSDV